MIAARLLAAALLAGLTADCHKADNAPGPGGVSMGEARALDAAGAAADAQRPAGDAVVIPDGPEADAASSQPAG